TSRLLVVPTTPARSAVATLSLHDALPIFRSSWPRGVMQVKSQESSVCSGTADWTNKVERSGSIPAAMRVAARSNIRSESSSGSRSEEHTSELQSRENLVCRLLLEKKNITT